MAYDSGIRGVMSIIETKIARPTRTILLKENLLIFCYSLLAYAGIPKHPRHSGKERH
jgi:hypothetical protein